MSQRRSINRFVIDRRRPRRAARPSCSRRGRAAPHRPARRPTPGQSGLCSPDMADFAQSLPGTTSRQVFLLSAASSIATIQGHVILDFDDVLAHGACWPSGRRSSTLAAHRSDDPGADFLRSVLIALDGAITFADRLAATPCVARAAHVDPDRAGRARRRWLARAPGCHCTRPEASPRLCSASGRSRPSSRSRTRSTCTASAASTSRLGPFYDRDLAEGRHHRDGGAGAARGAAAQGDEPEPAARVEHPGQLLPPLPRFDAGHRRRREARRHRRHQRPHLVGHRRRSRSRRRSPTSTCGSTRAVPITCSTGWRPTSVPAPPASRW